MVLWDIRCTLKSWKTQTHDEVPKNTKEKKVKFLQAESKPVRHIVGLCDHLPKFELVMVGANYLPSGLLPTFLLPVCHFSTNVTGPPSSFRPCMLSFPLLLLPHSPNDLSVHPSTEFDSFNLWRAGIDLKCSIICRLNLELTPEQGCREWLWLHPYGWNKNTVNDLHQIIFEASISDITIILTYWTTHLVGCAEDGREYQFITFPTSYNFRSKNMLLEFPKHVIQ